MAFDPIGDTINKGEQAAEKAADHIGQNAPGVFTQFLSALTRFRLKGSFSIELEDK